MLVRKWKSREIAKKNRRRTSPESNFPPLSTAGSPYVIAKNLAVFHYEQHVSQNLDIAERVTTHCDDIGERSGYDYPKFSFHIEHDGGTGRRALYRLHRRHTQLDHAGEFLGDRLGPGD